MGLFVRPAVCPSVQPSVRPSVHPSVRPSVRRSVGWSVEPKAFSLTLLQRCFGGPTGLWLALVLVFYYGVVIFFVGVFVVLLLTSISLNIWVTSLHLGERYDKPNFRVCK